MQFVTYSKENPMSEAQFHALWQLVCQSFPENGRRPPEELRALLANPAFRILTAQNADGRLFGILLLWVLPDFVFVENFAVVPALRSQGIGEKMLDTLAGQYEQPQVLEVEPPVNPIRQRRIAFYESKGFCMNECDFLLPCLHDGVVRSAPLKLMSRPLPLTQQALDKVLDALHTVIFSGKPVRK